MVNARSSADEDGQGSRSRQEDPRLGHHLQATPGHHRRLGVDQTMAALGVTPGHSSPATPAWSCLTRAGHRPVAWPHEIPDSGISHRNTGSSPCSGTEAGDSSPVFAALEHAAGDFTALGTDHSLECSSPPSDTNTGAISSKHALLEHGRPDGRSSRPPPRPPAAPQPPTWPSSPCSPASWPTLPALSHPSPSPPPA